MPLIVITAFFELTDLKLPAAIPRNNMDTKSLIVIHVNSKIIIRTTIIIIWQIYHYNPCSVLNSEISVLSLTSEH